MMKWIANNRKRRAAAAMALGALTVVAYAAIKLAPQRGVAIDVANVADDGTRARVLAYARAFEAGIEAFRRGDAHAAMIAFEEAAQVDPSSSQALVNLGFALVELGAYEAARARFARALQINDGQFNAYFGIAEALEGQGLLDQAAGAMRTYLYYAAADDPFRRRAEAALWEWGAAPAGMAATRQDVALQTGASIYDLSAVDLAGAETQFRDFEGEILVLNIWASWCPPCRRELPALDALAERLEGEGVRVVGLSVDANRDFVGEYLRRIDVDFPNLWDKDAALAREAFRIDAYPTTLLVSREGEIKAKIVGFRDWTSDEMVRQINAIK